MTDTSGHDRSQQVLSLLKDARRRNVPWLAVASSVEDLERTALVDASGRPWIRICAELSGYSPNHLRRMIKVKDFFSKKSPKIKPHDAGRLSEVSFSHLETLVRIYNIDRTLGNEIIDKVISGNLNHRRLLEILSDAKTQSPENSSPIAAGMLSASRFRTHCLTLTSQILIDRGGGDLQKMPNASVHVSPDFVMVARNGGHISKISGVDMYDLRGMDQSEIIKGRLLPAAMKATFFDVFWIVFASNDPWTIFHLLKKIGVYNVGMISVIENLEAFTVINEPQGGPVPDRTDLWKEYMPTKIKGHENRTASR